MAVSPFHRLSQGKARNFLEPECSARSEYYHPLSTRRRNVDPPTKAALRTRASVRRASGFVQIAIALTDPGRESPKFDGGSRFARFETGSVPGGYFDPAVAATVAGVFPQQRESTRAGKER